MRNLIKLIVRKIIYLYEYPINYLILKINHVEYDKMPEIRGIIFIRNHGKFKIGSNVIINSKMSANPIGGTYKTTIAVKHGAELIIGDNVGISNSAIMCNKGITIGDNAMIGGDCRIYDTDFHSISYKDRLNKEDMNISEKSIDIGKNVFIGTGCIILKGVTIGDRSVIGAGAVVTNNISESQLWAGNPARFIRQL